MRVVLVSETVLLARSVLWAHAVELIDLHYDDAVDHLEPHEIAANASDREVVLFSETIPGVDGPNPMQGLMDWEMIDDPRFPRPVQVRIGCCLNYLIPGRGSYCRSCARIEPEERLQLWRAWGGKNLF